MSIISPKKTVTHFPNSIVDEEWEYLDPTPDIHVLFLQFNERFFNGKLASVVVKWSPRMTVCAGLCRYEGKRGMCSISLSMPLLKLRPRKNLVETLLHEMIHAFLFLTQNNRDRDGHGPEFQSHMHRINRESGTNITIYHSFHDEVRLYKQHWWKCNGPCKDRKPFYGLVKRSMNRAPGRNDTWWAQHEATCGGSFTKIKEPENYGVKKKKEASGSSSQSTHSGQSNSKKPKFSHSSGSQDIRGFLKSPSTSGLKSTAPSSVPAVTSTKGKSLIGSGGILSKNKGSSTVTVKSPSLGSPGPSGSVDAKPTQGGVVSKPASNFVAFTGRGHTLGGGVIPRVEKPPQASTISKPKAVEIVSLDDSRETAPQENMAPCPVCGMSVAVSHINQHLDLCLKL